MPDVNEFLDEVIFLRFVTTVKLVFFVVAGRKVC